MKTDVTPSAAPSLENAIAGRYDFSIKKIMQEAWAKTSGFKMHMWKAFLLVMLVVVVVSMPVYMIVNALTADLDTSDANLITLLSNLLLSIFIIQPLFAGLIMIVIRHSVGEMTPINSVFSYFKYWNKLWVIPVISTILSLVNALFPDVAIVQLLVIFAFIYVFVSYFMYLPLIVDKQLSIWSAMEGSRKAIAHHWFKTFGLLIVVGIVGILSAFTLFIAFIWTLPWLYNAVAIYYRDVFGVKS